MIKPTVGRVVWYQPNDADAKSLGDGTQPIAAHVAYVHSDTLVNLMVIDSNGNPWSRTSVRLMQAGESPLVGESFCEWMPYQVGQAAKAEAANAAKVSVASEEAYLRRWAVETAMQAVRDNVPDARQDTKAYAEKLRAWVAGEDGTAK